MSVHHLNWAMSVETRSPIHKLILVMGAASSSSDGIIRTPIGNEVCASDEAVSQAIIDLVHDGLLIAGGPLTLNAPSERHQGRPSWDPSASLRKRVLDRDGHACVACGATEKLCLDHIYPRRRGGSDEDSNLQTLCAPCNTSKGGKLPGEWMGRK